MVKSSLAKLMCYVIIVSQVCGYIVCNIITSVFALKRLYKGCICPGKSHEFIASHIPEYHISIYSTWRQAWIHIFELCIEILGQLRIRL